MGIFNRNQKAVSLNDKKSIEANSLEDLIWNELKCTMDKTLWENLGKEYSELPIKLLWGKQEKTITFSIKYYEVLDLNKVDYVLRDFILRWDDIHEILLQRIVEWFVEFQDIKGEKSELSIKSCNDMLEYVSPASLIIQEHPKYGMCAGMALGEKWDVHYDDYEDIGVIIVDGKVVAIKSSEIV